MVSRHIWVALVVIAVPSRALRFLVASICLPDQENAVWVLGIRLRFPRLLRRKIAGIASAGMCQNIESERRVFCGVVFEVDRVVVYPAQLLDAWV
jgi:hypothetical protein